MVVETCAKVTEEAKFYVNRKAGDINWWCGRRGDSGTESNDETVHQVTCIKIVTVKETALKCFISSGKRDQEE